jgi:hypothetical protein
MQKYAVDCTDWVDCFDYSDMDGANSSMRTKQHMCAEVTGIPAPVLNTTKQHVTRMYSMNSSAAVAESK